MNIPKGKLWIAILSDYFIFCNLLALFVCLKGRVERADCQNESSCLAENYKQFPLILKLGLFFQKNPASPPIPELPPLLWSSSWWTQNVQPALFCDNSLRIICHMANLSFTDTSHWNLLLICSGHLQAHFRPLSIPNYSSVFHVSGSPLDKGKTYLFVLFLFYSSLLIHSRSPWGASLPLSIRIRPPILASSIKINNITVCTPF